VRVLFSVAGQVEVDRGRLERPVAEGLLDEPLDESQVDAGLEEMGGVAVAERVNGDAFLDPELGDDTPECVLDGRLGQGLRRRVSLGATAAEGGEEEARVKERAASMSPTWRERPSERRRPRE
jgi:hypothetical protein